MNKRFRTEDPPVPEETLGALRMNSADLQALNAGPCGNSYNKESFDKKIELRENAHKQKLLEFELNKQRELLQLKSQL
jgi:hypothetical protein